MPCIIRIQDSCLGKGLTLVPRKHFVKKVNNSYWNFVREVEEVNEDGAARVEEE